jgi:hypothetical protein
LHSCMKIELCNLFKVFEEGGGRMKESGGVNLLEVCCLHAWKDHK